MFLSFSFYDKNKDFNLLKKMLYFINACKFKWIIGDSDVYNYSTLENIFKTSNYSKKEYTVYSGNELMSLINENIFYVFVEMYAFNPVDFFLEYNDDYILNNCEIAIIIDDCNYYTVYLREEKLYTSLLSFLQSNGIDDIQSNQKN